MREKTRKLTGLAEEFRSLKSELFGNNSFVVLPEGEKTDRYNQLLGLFYPQFRTKGWRDPLKEAV